MSGSDERVWFKARDRTPIGHWTPQVGIAGGQGGAHVHYALHIAQDDYAAAVERLREQGYDPHEEDFEATGKAAYVTDRTETSSSSGPGKVLANA
jgi:hypothetical protein